MFNRKRLVTLCCIFSMLFLLSPSSDALAEDLPDLVVTDVLWSPETVYDGDEVTFTVVIKNQGTAPTPEGTVSAPLVYVNGKLVGYTDTYTKTIQPGESVSIPIQTGPLDGKWLALEGEHTVSGRVDDINRIKESDETNNWYTESEKMTVTVRQGPDLVVKNMMWSPKRMMEGEKMTFSAVLENAGNQPTPQGLKHKLSFILNGSEIASSELTLDALQPGQTITVESNSGPEGGIWTAVAGNYRMQMIADASGALAEAKEDNNSLFIDLTVGEKRLQTAKQADAFVDSIGVNTHLHYWDTAYSQYETIIKPKLLESGIRHVRDSASGQSLFIERMKDLAASGIHLTAITDLRYLTPDQAVSVIKSLNPAVEMVEGPNEYNHSNDPDWVAKLRAYTSELYDKLKGDPDTSGLPIVGPSLIYNPPDGKALGDLTPWVDYGNMHSYPGGLEPTKRQEDNFSLAAPVYGNKPMLSTESGYHTFNGCSGSQCSQPGVSEKAEAKYMPRLFLEYFNRGIVRTFKYELIDQKPDEPKTNQEKHFGLLRNDGSEKPSFTAVANLISVLNDKGPAFTPGTLNYTLSGNTTNLHHTLLQKRDGSFYLIFWVDATSFDLLRNADKAVPDQYLTLTLNRPVSKVSMIRPNSSTAEGQQINNPKTFTFQVLDEPLIVKLVQ